MLKQKVSSLINKHGKKKAVISCNVELIDYTGSLSSAIMLSQLLYWADRTLDQDGWVYKSNEEWENELGLGSKVTRNAKTNLIQIGAVETKVIKDKKGRTVTHYRVAPSFLKDLEKFLLDRNGQVGLTETVKSDGPKRSNGPDQNGQVGLTETVNSYITKNTNIDYTKIKRTYISEDEAEEILKTWNDQQVTIALSLTQKIHGKIEEVIQTIPLSDFLQSIKNYGIIQRGSEYFFKHKYTLETFVTSGLQNKGFVHFLDRNDPFTRFRARDGTESVETKFEPVTEHYNAAKKADFEANTYYGFNLDQIKSAEERIDDLDRMLKRDSVKWTFGKFWNLELCISALLFNRKSKPEPEKLKYYMDIWQEYRGTFEGMLEE